MEKTKTDIKLSKRDRLLRQGADGFRVLGMTFLLAIQVCVGETSADVYQAAEEGRLRDLQVWIDSPSYDAGATDEKGRTPLWYASSRGHLAAVDLLIENGGKINLADRYGVSPLVVAIRRGWSQVVRELLRAGAKPVPEHRAPFIPLHVAVEEGNADIVFDLLSAGADPLTQQATGDPATDLVWNAMIRSRIRGMALGFFLFLGSGGSELTLPVASEQSGAVLEIRDEDGNTVFETPIPGGVSPPSFTIRWDHRDQSGSEIVAGMYDVDLQTPGGQGTTQERRAIHLREIRLEDAAAYTHPGIIRTLKRLGADLDARADNGRTALMMAAAFGNTETAAALLGLGADPTLRDAEDQSAFDYAERYAPGQKVGLLLKRATAGVEIAR
jgi:uncharacterized protein